MAFNLIHQGIFLRFYKISIFGRKVFWVLTLILFIWIYVGINCAVQKLALSSLLNSSLVCVVFCLLKNPFEEIGILEHNFFPQTGADMQYGIAIREWAPISLLKLHTHSLSAI